MKPFPYADPLNEGEIRHELYEITRQTNLLNAEIRRLTIKHLQPLEIQRHELERKAATIMEWLDALARYKKAPTVCKPSTKSTKPSGASRKDKPQKEIDTSQMSKSQLRALIERLSALD